MSVNVYQIVTNKIIEQLEKGIVPWQKSWCGVLDGSINYVTRKPYSLLNQILLCDRVGEYLTFKQIQDLKGTIKKGAKSSVVVFYTQIPVKDKNTDEVLYTRPCLKYYNVFHIDDVCGIESKSNNNYIELNPIEEAETIINDYLSRETSLKFINNILTDKAYYSPTNDLVQVPMMKQYTDINEYYSTTFHEFIHSTLIEKRCNRKQKDTISKFGSEEYSKEELTAEIGSAMLCNIIGIDTEKVFKNSVNYIGSWLKALKNDNLMIIRAAAQAEKAVKYIRNKE
jgi:antirestriction protein ArdC